MQTLVDFVTWELAAANGVVALAGLLRGFAGFGSGMMMAPIFAILFGPAETVAIIVTMELCVSVQLFPGASRDIQWRFVILMGVAAGIFMPLGAWILVEANPAILTRIMAAIVLLFVAILAVGWRYPGEKRIPITLGVGALSGAMMASTSMGNPPVLLYMLSGADDATTNRANIIGYFVVTQVILIATLAGSAILGWSAMARAFLFLPVYLLSAWIGGRLFRASNEILYRRIALLFLLGAGLIGLLR